MEGMPYSFKRNDYEKNRMNHLRAWLRYETAFVT